MPEIMQHKEVSVFCRYLSGKKATPTVALLYAEAIQKRFIPLTKKDERILNFLLNKPFFIGCVDGAMAFFAKDSAVRKRIFIMLAVLETLPEYAAGFLSRKHSFWYLFAIGARAFRAVYRLIFGFVILRLI